ncbi:fumarylacetoacetate hydrolase family protein [Cuniculiplasma sp. SKW4]|uniref:fumarylacetoacetate hydrolase family protein n=1 Tax=Cuniculiplasma sp. SKW4 TaxID=3400171 RepID=UPI003FD6647C
MQIEFLKNNGKLSPCICQGNGKKYLKMDISINQFYSDIKKYTEMIEKEGEWIEQTGETVLPVNPSKILCPALNFRSHSGETNQKTPNFPYFFPKFITSLTSFDSDIIKPRSVVKLDYEGEIAAVIGKRLRDASLKQSSESIAAYAVVNDVSARDIQNQYSEGLGKNWIMGKASDTFLPISASVYFGDINSFDIITSVNGEIRQNGNTEDMIFSFPEMISYISKFVTLIPGDIILSGTPSGVANSGKFPFLKNGDIVRIESKEIGYISNRVKDSD